jgi:hypothetical protein
MIKYFFYKFIKKKILNDDEQEAQTTRSLQGVQLRPTQSQVCVFQVKVYKYTVKSFQPVLITTFTALKG